MLTKGVFKEWWIWVLHFPAHPSTDAHCQDSTVRVQQRHLVLTPGSARRLFCGWHICISSQASRLGLLERAERANKLSELRQQRS